MKEKLKIQLNRRGGVAAETLERNHHTNTKILLNAFTGSSIAIQKSTLHMSEGKARWKKQND